MIMTSEIAIRMICFISGYLFGLLALSFVLSCDDKGYKPDVNNNCNPKPPDDE